MANELTLTIYEDTIIPGGEKERIIRSIRKGENEIDIWGVKYLISTREVSRFHGCGEFKTERNYYKIIASRMFPVVMPGGC